MTRIDPAPAPPPTWLRDEATLAARLIVITVAALGAIYLLLQVTTVSVAAFLAFTQAALLWPLVRRLRRFMPAVLAAILCVAVYLAAFLSLFWVVGVRVLGTWNDLAQAALGGLSAINRWATDSGLQIPAGVVNAFQDQVQQRIGTIASGVGNAAVSSLGVVGALGTVLVLAIFLTLFALTTGDALWASILAVIPGARRRHVDRAFRATVGTARGWMFASTVTGLVDGLFIGLGLWVLGVPLALPIGVLTFVLGYVPMVGATLAGAVAVIVALFFGGPITALWALLIVLAVQQIEGNVLSPLLLSRAMKFNPIVTLLLASAGGTAFGIVGLFLAVPLAGILTAAVKAWRGTEDEPSDTVAAVEASNTDADDASDGAEDGDHTQRAGATVAPDDRADG